MADTAINQLTHKSCLHMPRAISSMRTPTFGTVKPAPAEPKGSYRGGSALDLFCRTAAPLLG